MAGLGHLNPRCSNLALQEVPAEQANDSCLAARVLMTSKVLALRAALLACMMDDEQGCKSIPQSRPDMQDGTHQGATAGLPHAPECFRELS